MGTMPVNRLMLRMGAPMILSMMLQAVYNIVDSYFVSNMPGGMGEAGVNALTLAFPVQMLMVAVGIGTGVGTNALIARALGQNDKDKACKAAGNAMTLGAAMFVVFLLFGLFGARAYIGSQTQDAQVLEMGVQYLTICCTVSCGIVFFSIFEKILQSTGRSLYSTIAQITGALINIVLDPIMIYGLLGCPALGIAGAAWATVLGQLASMLLAAVFHFRLDRELPFSRRHLRPRAGLIGEIYAIGVPAILAQGAMSVMNYCINVLFGGLGSSYVTAYGIFYKIQQFVLFAAFGLRDAITPIVSYSYGMQDKKRIRDGVRWGVWYTLALMLVCTALLELFAEPLAALFSLSDATQALCVDAMRVVSAGFVFAGANIALQGVFQALGCGIESLAVSLLRQLIIVLPAAWVFAVFAPQLVWIAFVLAEVFTAAIAVGLLHYCMKKTVEAPAPRHTPSMAKL